MQALRCKVPGAVVVIALLALLTQPAATASASGVGPGGRALTSLRPLGISLPPSGAVTRLEALKTIEVVAGITPFLGGSQTYSDVPPGSAAFGIVGAAGRAGLLVDWAPVDGAFQPNTPISRLQLAILATNAMGLVARADALETDETLYRGLRDITRTGYDLGFANLMLQMGIVPPLDATRYAPQGAVSVRVLALALVRMWQAVDVPRAALLTPAASEVLVGGTDAIVLAATNKLGTAVPSANLPAFFHGYTASGAASVKGGAFTSSVAGPYTVSTTLTGPLMAHALLVEGSIVVTLEPPPLTAPTGLTAREVAGGASLTWSPGASQRSYQVLEAVNGSDTYSPVSAANGGAPAAYETSATITGLTNGDTYTFEVEAVGGGGSTETSDPSPSTLYGVTPPTALTATASDGGTSVTLSWTPGDGESSYQVLAAANGSTTYSAVSGADGGTPSATGSAATLTGLTPGDAYTFKLEATNAFGLGATAGPSSACLYDFTAPTEAEAADALGGLDLSWTPGSGDTGYAIYEAESPSTSYSPVSGPDGGSVAAGADSTVITGLTQGASYTFEVQAQNDNLTTTSTFTATTPSAVQYGVSAPSTLNAAEVRGGIQLTWTLSPGASDYQVLEQTGGAGSFDGVTAADGGTPTTGTTIVTGLTLGDAYAFEVEAQDTPGNTSAVSPSAGAGYGATVAANFSAGAYPVGTITLNSLETTTVDATATLTAAAANVPAGSGFQVSIAQGAQGKNLQFNAGDSVAADIQELLSAALGEFPSLSWTQSGSVFTVSYPGGAGDTFELSTGDANVVTIDGSTSTTSAYLAGGQDPDEITLQTSGSPTLAATLVAVASSPDASEFTDNADLADAIDGAGLPVNATAAGTTEVDLVGLAYGSSDALEMSVNNPLDISLSGGEMTGGELPVITLTFSQSVDPSTLSTSNFASVLELSGGSTFGTGATAQWNTTGTPNTVLTITCGSDATVATGATLSVPASVLDGAGNPVPANLTL